MNYYILKFTYQVGIHSDSYHHPKAGRDRYSSRDSVRNRIRKIRNSFQSIRQNRSTSGQFPAVCTLHHCDTDLVRRSSPRHE